MCCLCVTRLACLTLSLVPFNFLSQHLPGLLIDFQQQLCRFINGEEVLDFYGIDHNAFGNAVGSLFGLAIFYVTLAGILLKVLSMRVADCVPMSPPTKASLAADRSAEAKDGTGAGAGSRVGAGAGGTAGTGAAQPRPGTRVRVL